MDRFFGYFQISSDFIWEKYLVFPSKTCGLSAPLSAPYGAPKEAQERVAFGSFVSAAAREDLAFEYPARAPLVAIEHGLLCTTGTCQSVTGREAFPRRFKIFDFKSLRELKATLPNTKCLTLGERSDAEDSKFISAVNSEGVALSAPLGAPERKAFESFASAAATEGVAFEKKLIAKK